MGQLRTVALVKIFNIAGDRWKLESQFTVRKHLQKHEGPHSCLH